MSLHLLFDTGISIFEEIENLKYLKYREPYKVLNGEYEGVRGTVYLVNTNLGTEHNELPLILEVAYLVMKAEVKRLHKDINLGNVFEALDHNPEALQDMREAVWGETQDGFMFDSPVEPEVSFMLWNNDGKFALALLLRR